MSEREGPQFFEYANCDNHLADEWGYLKIPEFEEWLPLGVHNQHRMLTGYSKELFFEGEGVDEGPILRYFRRGKMKPHKSTYWMYLCANPAYSDIWVREKISPLKYVLNVFHTFPSPHTVRVSLCNLAGSEICHHMSSTDDNVFHNDVMGTLMEVLDVDLERVRFVHCIGEKSYMWGFWSSVGGPPQNELYSCDEQHAAVRASAMVPKTIVDSGIVHTNKRVVCKTGLKVESAIRLRHKTTVSSMFIDGPPYRFVRSYKFVKRVH